MLKDLDDLKLSFKAWPTNKGIRFEVSDPNGIWIAAGYTHEFGVPELEYIEYCLEMYRGRKDDR